MKSRRQALKLCLDTAVVVIVKIFDELLFEVFHIRHHKLKHPLDVVDLQDALIADIVTSDSNIAV